MTSNFLDNTCTKIQNMAFKTSQMDQIVLEYRYYGFLGRLRDRNQVAAHALRQTVEVNQSNGGNLRI